MKITNNHDLPEVLHRAASHDEYSKGEADFSVTELISPPRIQILQKRHNSKMSMDITDRIWSLLGTAVHKIIEDASDGTSLSEERLYAKINGWTVSGGVDLQKISDNSIGIIDFKVTSVYAAMSDKPEWAQQLNSYAYLVEANRSVWEKVKKLQICAILRDWKASDAKRDRSYPQQPIILIDIPLWSWEDRKRFLEDRVEVHHDAWAKSEFGESIPECTNEERWESGGKYIVEREGYKRVWRAYDKPELANAEGKKVGGVVSYRDGKFSRCAGDYCGVARWCNQWNEGQEVT